MSAPRSTQASRPSLLRGERSAGGLRTRPYGIGRTEPGGRDPALAGSGELPPGAQARARAAAGHVFKAATRAPLTARPRDGDRFVAPIHERRCV